MAISKDAKRDYDKDYHLKPGIKEKRRAKQVELLTDPEVLERKREYDRELQRKRREDPEVKAKQRAYAQDPANKARIAEQRRARAAAKKAAAQKSLNQRAPS